MMARPIPARRHQAINHVADLIGNDMVTTHEIWEMGQALIASGAKWPPYTKQAFKSFRTTTALGNMMSRHPDWSKVGDKAVRMGGVRTQLWQRR